MITKLDMRELLAQINKETKPFAGLGIGEQCKVILSIFRLQTRVVFSNRFAWFMAGLFAYCAFVYVVNYNEDVYSRIDIEGAFIFLLEIPLTALALFINMTLVASEKNNRTLEIMFTTAGSRYKVWLLRFGSLCMILFLLSNILSIITFFFFWMSPFFL